MRTQQKFVAVYASVSNRFNQERGLSSRQNFLTNRTAAFAEWRGLCAAPPSRQIADMPFGSRRVAP